MQIKKKRALGLVVLLVCVYAITSMSLVEVNAKEITRLTADGLFSYKSDTENNGYMIVKYLGKETTVVIPNLINGKPVTAIGDWAFWSTAVTEIVFPESLRSVGKGAFYECKQLQSIKLPDGLTDLAPYAFGSCDALTSFNIPKGITKIPAYAFDMYPLYWTTSKEGIFMRYSYEFKLMCVELYHSGLYPDIPEDTNPDTLKRHIREWSGLVDLHGPEVLKHKVFNKVWTPEEKLELVLKVIAGIPKRKVATEAGISPGILYQWIYKYKSQGYNGLVGSKKGRSTKELKMKKSTNPLPLTESEREELMRLRSENEYIKAENEIIKKRIALRQEKWAAQLKAKKQQSSRTSEKKDTN